MDHIFSEQELDRMEVIRFDLFDAYKSLTKARILAKNVMEEFPQCLEPSMITEMTETENVLKNTWLRIYNYNALAIQQFNLLKSREADVFDFA